MGALQTVPDDGFYLPRQETINYDKIEKEIIPYLRIDVIKNS